MPTIREPTPDELQYIQSQGVDISKLPAKLEFDDNWKVPSGPQTSTLGAVGSSLKAHTGGILGGGLGALTAGSLIAAPESAGTSLLVPLIAGALGAAGGGYAGQKAQELIQGPETTERLSQQAQQAEKEHPIATTAADIAAGALASGGWPKPSNIPKAIRGLLGRESLSATDTAAMSQVGREALSPAGNEILAKNASNAAALKNVAIQSVVNPALNTGIGLATGQGIPSPTDLLAQAAGGALFSGGNPLLHRGDLNIEKQEPNATGQTQTSIPELSPNPERQSPFKQSNEKGQPVIDDTAIRSAFKEMNPRPDTTNLSDVESYKVQSDWRKMMKLPVEQQRDALHKAYLEQQDKLGQVQIPKTEPVPEITTKTQPELTKPIVPEMAGQRQPLTITPQEIAEQIRQNAAKGISTAPPIEQSQTVFKRNEDSWKDLRANDQERLDAIKTWLSGEGEKPPAPKSLYRGIPVGATPTLNEQYTHVTPWGYVAARGGKGAFGDPRAYEVHETPSQGEEHIYYRGGALAESPLETTRIMNAFGMTWDQVLNKGKDILTKRIERINKRFVNTNPEFEGWSEENLKLSKEDAIEDETNKVVNDIRVATFESDALNKPGQWRINKLPARANRPYPQLLTNEEIETAKNPKPLTAEEEPIEQARLKEEIGVNAPKSNMMVPVESRRFYKEFSSNEEAIAKVKELAGEKGKMLDFLSTNSKYNQGEIKAFGNTVIIDPSLLNRQEIESLQKMGFSFSGEKPQISTVQQEMNRIAANPNDKYNELAKSLKLDETSSKVPIFFKETPEGIAGSYFAKKDVIHINPNYSAHSGAIIHESLHAATLRKMPQEWATLKGWRLKGAMDEYLKSGSNQSVKDIVSAYYDTAKHLGLSRALFEIAPKESPNLLGTKQEKALTEGLAGHPHEAHELGLPHGYAMGDPYEFITGALTDQRFQKHLNEMPSGLNDGKSMWSRLVDAIRRLIGVDVKHGSMLERVLKPIEELSAQERPKKGTGYATPARIESGSNREEHLGASSRTDLSENEKEKGQRTSEQTIYSNRNVGSRTEQEIEKRPLQLKPTQSVIDKIRDIQHPAAKKLADAAQKALSERDPRVGVTWNKIKQTMDKVGYTKADGEQLAKISRWENLNHAKAPSDMFHNEAQRIIYNIERQVYDESGKYRLAINEPVYRGNRPTQLIQDPTSHPNTPDPKIVEIYRKNTDTAEIARLDKVFLDNAKQHGFSEPEANDALKNWKEGVQGNWQKEGGNLQFYNAMRRSQGIPLPEEFARKDYAKNLEVYYNRAATDNTFYKHIESNPEVMAALGAKFDAWQRPITPDPTGGIAGHSDVKALINEFKGEPGSLGLHNEKAVSNLAATLFISWPGLQTHKSISNIITGLQSYTDNPFQYARILGNAIKNGIQGYQHAVENGAMKLTARSFTDVFGGSATAAERMQAVAQGIRRISTFNDWTEKWSVGLMQAGAEEVVSNKIAKAAAGDATSQQLLKRLDPDYTRGKDYTDKDKTLLASNLVGFIHGTGDARTMPAWMLNDSEVSGFFKLAHWSVSQTNRFMTDVLSPAIQHGNWAPMVNSIFGAAIGGYMIKEIREMIAGKRSQLPSLQEINASSQPIEKKLGLYGYEFMAAAQYAGFGGLLSQVAKYPFDFVYKNHPQGATFPMDEVVTDLASTLGDVTSAAANDPNFNWLHAAEFVTAHLLTTNIQLARAGYNQAVNAGLITGTLAEKKMLADKMGQLRRFNMVEGLPYNEQDQGANPYMNIEQKAFKMTQNPEEAAKMLPELVTNIVHNYSDKPDVMMQKIKALKQNSYATMPSMETTPLSFYKYMAFLSKTEGEDKAKEAFTDYMKHRIMNEAKASAVP